jgi:hypothetical protein
MTWRSSAPMSTCSPERLIDAVRTCQRRGWRADRGCWRRQHSLSTPAPVDFSDPDTAPGHGRASGDRRGRCVPFERVARGPVQKAMEDSWRRLRFRPQAVATRGAPAAGIAHARTNDAIAYRGPRRSHASRESATLDTADGCRLNQSRSGGGGSDAGEFGVVSTRRDRL